MRIGLIALLCVLALDFTAGMDNKRKGKMRDKAKRRGGSKSINQPERRGPKQPTQPPKMHLRSSNKPPSGSIAGKRTKPFKATIQPKSNPEKAEQKRGSLESKDYRKYLNKAAAKKAVSLVYIVREEFEDGTYKIGSTERPLEERLGEIFKKGGVIVVVRKIITPSRIFVEKLLHKKLEGAKEKRPGESGGTEWYRVSLGQIDKAIEEVKRDLKETKKKVQYDVINKKESFYLAPNPSVYPYVSRKGKRFKGG
eukprot:TRINITY_DN9859_c0_g1_i5.p1 TRINITY_DN9859_c0_g1~~TRINITY_DN9859_c0_g1_i5.p1  ORF type:complete len:253 (-),score=10.78 TRINITY_DN9859_c0_g1_i5:38-796(-)